MRIIGINSSHDTSLCIMEDGVVRELFEEERERRDKYYSPKLDEPELHVVNSKGLADALTNEDGEPCGELVFASFDRRDMKLHMDKEYIMDNRLIAEDLAIALAKSQLTTARIEELKEEFPKLGMNEEWMEEMDETIHDAMCKQFDNMDEYHYDTEHHMYHAYSGYYLSPFFERGEDAIAIAWDGGGAKSYHETHPNYQEIESIWSCKFADKTITPQWKKMSNHRTLGDIASTYFPNMYYDSAHCLTDEEITMDGIDVVLTSFPSSGMNFSNMSYAFGADTQGRAAGKVMGMASYGRLIESQPDRHDRHTVAQMCEETSFNNACNVIRKAMEYNPDCKNLVLSGGFSLNCTNNYKYLQEFPELNIFVDPVPHDGGTAVGAAYWLHWNIEAGKDEPSTGDTE
jgi:predicted NodU family carbamoyl transferase